MQLLANDSYKTGQFLHAAKAFDVLERLDHSEESWQGKLGACIGLFQMVVAEIEPKDSLIECIMMLRNSDNPQVEYVIGVMTNWAEVNGLLPVGEE